MILVFTNEQGEREQLYIPTHINDQGEVEVTL